MSLFDEPDNPRWKLLSAAQERLGSASDRDAVIAVVRSTARSVLSADGVTFVKSMIMTPVNHPPVAAIGAYWQDKRRFSEREVQAIKTLSLAVGRALAICL